MSRRAFLGGAALALSGCALPPGATRSSNRPTSALTKWAVKDIRLDYHPTAERADSLMFGSDCEVMNGRYDPAGHCVLQRATDNRLTNPLFVSDATEAPGPLWPLVRQTPTGWDATGPARIRWHPDEGNAEEVLLTVRFLDDGRVGIRHSASGPASSEADTRTSGFAFSIDVRFESSDTEHTKVYSQFRIRSRDPEGSTVLTSQSAREGLAADVVEREIVFAPARLLGERFSPEVVIEARHGTLVAIHLARPMLEPASGVQDATEFSTHSRPSSRVRLYDLPPGTYDVLLRGTDGDEYLLDHPCELPDEPSGRAALVIGGDDISGSLGVQRILLFPSGTLKRLFGREKPWDVLDKASYRAIPRHFSATSRPLNLQIAELKRAGPHSIQASTNRRNSAVRFEVRPGDNPDGQRHGATERSEIGFDAGTCVGFGQAVWVAFDYCLLNDLRGTANGDARTLHQWRYLDDEGTRYRLSPDFQFLVNTNGGLSVYTRVGDKRVTSNPPLSRKGLYDLSNPSGVGATHQRIHVPHGQLLTREDGSTFRYRATRTIHRIVYRLVFHQTRGYLDFFLDGAPLYSGPVVAGYDRRRPGYGESDSGVGPQPRIGMYRARNDVETSVVEFRNVDIRPERDGSLRDRVAAPLAY